jgi:hypothetical protein
VPEASTCSSAVSVTENRPAAPVFAETVRRSSTPAPASGVPVPVSRTALIKDPSESGTPSLVPIKSEEPVLIERRKLGS